MIGEPKGRVMRKKRTFLTRRGNEGSCLQERVLMFVESGHRDQRKAWAHWCKRLGVEAVEVQRIGTRVWYDCCGSAGSLDELNDMAIVVESCNVLHVAPGPNVAGPGWGERD